MFRFVKTVVLLAVAFTSLGTRAAEPAREPADIVRMLRDSAVAVTANGMASESYKVALLRRLLARHVDLPIVGRFVLGRHWRAASPVQRAEFLCLFEALLATDYLRLFANPDAFALTVDRQVLRDDHSAFVYSHLSRPAGDAIDIRWQMRRDAHGDWRAVDVKIEELSAAVIRRAEFRAVLRRNGGKLADLFQQIRDKLPAPDRAGTGGNRQCRSCCADAQSLLATAPVR